MNATNNALTYCAIFGMGSSLIVMPPNAPMSFPLPVARMADALLAMLMDETKRLVREKEYAVHAVAAALLEQGELIGVELEEVFEKAEADNRDKSGPFERKLISLPRLFRLEGMDEGAYPEVAVQPTDVAAAVDEGAAMRRTAEPGRAWWPAPQDVPPPHA
jgi:hypothetical protein